MESGDRERAHVYVSGSVQGVFFGTPPGSRRSSSAWQAG